MLCSLHCANRHSGSPSSQPLPPPPKICPPLTWGRSRWVFTASTLRKMDSTSHPDFPIEGVEGTKGTVMQLGPSLWMGGGRAHTWGDIRSPPAPPPQVISVVSPLTVSHRGQLEHRMQGAPEVGQLLWGGVWGGQIIK